MRKLFISVAAIALLSTASFADQNSENAQRMDELRKQYFAMTMKMVNDQMEMMKKQQAILSNFQRLLKQQAENESSGN